MTTERGEVNPYCAEGRRCGVDGHSDHMARLDWNHSHCSHCDQAKALRALRCAECELELTPLPDRA